MNRSCNRYHRAKQLSFEQLEDRSVMAATLTAALTDGVLRVEGTTRDDQIVLRRSGGTIVVEGMSGTFKNDAVKSIVVETLGGNDRIKLDGLNVTGQPFNRPITIRNSGGSDTVRGPDGKDLFFSGGHTETIDKGQTRLDGKEPDWFDRNTRDEALRQLLKQDFADRVVNRQEMLDVFRQVSKDGTVSAGEFEDLKAVAKNATLFNTVSYVGVLTRDVVLGSPANQLFQGTTLGNLTAGSSAGKLDKLVGKWFLGADHPLATYGNMTFSYTVAAGTLFSADGPKFSDVNQGAVGDCYFVGTLGEIAARAPNDVRNMFIVNGDGTYTVRFFNHGRADFVTVDSQLPVDKWGRFVFANMGDYAKNTGNVLWVALAEKAYVQMNEAGWLRPSDWSGGKNVYDAISGGMMSDVLHQVSNRDAINAYVGTSGQSFQQFVSAYNVGQMIGFASKSSPSSASIVGGHQYVVVGYNATTRQVTLFNPWGLDNGSEYPGLVTLSWTEIELNFSYWTHSA